MTPMPLLLATLSLGALSVPALAAAPDGRGWPGEELPLPLAVRTAQDLAVKAVAERQYLIFNLLAGGKLAWDSGDFATAAAKWEALLRVHGLDAEVDKVIRPLAREARSRAGGQPSTAPPVAALPPESPTPAAAADAARAAPAFPSVSGTVSGGGAQGPGGAVIWLKRVGGETPRPAPARGKVITQRNKTFIPRVLAVPVGSKVSFRNEDAIFHNVFSLSKPNDFDTGLYKQGATYTQTFKRAGRRPDPVQHPLVDAGLRLRRRLAVLRAGRQRRRVRHQGCPARRLRASRCGTRRRRRRSSSGCRSARTARAASRSRSPATSALRSSSPTSRASRASPTSATSG